MYQIGNRMGEEMLPKVVAWTHPAQAARYEEMAQAVSTIQKGSKSDGVNLYFSDNMQLAGAPLKQSFSWNKRRIDFIAMEFWGRSEIQPVGYYTDKGGRKFFEARSTDGGVAASDIFYLVSGMGFYHTNPGVGGYIKNLAVPAGY
jgi:hypothetical protein